jgi:hypothetical protein
MKAAKLKDTGLTPAREAFAREFLTNGGNAMAAYRKAYPKCKMSSGNASRAACRLLAAPAVAEFLAKLRERANSEAVSTRREILETLTKGIRELRDAKEWGTMCHLVERLCKLEAWDKQKDAGGEIPMMTMQFVGFDDPNKPRAPAPPPPAAWKPGRGA